MSDEPWSQDFIARRNAARARLDAMNPHLKPGGDVSDLTRVDWFSTVYDVAGDDPANIPWARLAPNPFLAEWLAQEGALTGQRALDVGCGLGDNAEALAAAGAKVTAFDYIGRAIEWAKQRFPQSLVEYRVANLLEPLEEWRNAFDLVHETYTLQALAPSLLPRAAHTLASFVAPSGRLVVITSAREDSEPQTTPWRPLTRADIDGLSVDGLTLETLEDIPEQDEFTPRHWRATLTRRGG
jgi:2-polyprenyl-3-methyl-5-hydroxy-6-metoxy-1,4-benzoquinol methylase